jgi:hypothetical protein
VNWDPLEAFEGLREPFPKTCASFPIEFLEEFVQGLQAIRWLQALDPTRNRSSRDDAIAVAVSGSEPGNTNRPRRGIATPSGSEVIADVGADPVLLCRVWGWSRVWRPCSSDERVRN